MERVPETRPRRRTLRSESMGAVEIVRSLLTDLSTGRLTKLRIGQFMTMRLPLVERPGSSSERIDLLCNLSVPSTCCRRGKCTSSRTSLSRDMSRCTTRKDLSSAFLSSLALRMTRLPTSETFRSPVRSVPLNVGLMTMPCSTLVSAVSGVMSEMESRPVAAPMIRFPLTTPV